jgi:cyclophilin family peptidyl-prolyl cis-trans isomerase
VLAQLQQDNPEDVRIVYRHFPLIGTPEQPFHDKASLSARAADAAGLQDKFWEMHDLLFERQSEWARLSVDEFHTWLVAAAGELELDVEEFTTVMDSQEMVDQAQEAWDRGNEIGLPGTPFLLVNGSVWPSSVPMNYSNLSAMVSLTQLAERQFTECPEMTIDVTSQYVATLHTNKGDIVIELYPDKAPFTVNSFIFLANNGWYDNVMFHRVVEGFVAQAGDPTGTGYGGPGYAYVSEISPDLAYDKPGVVGMANAGPDSNGSQFCITLAPTPNLNNGYTIFGQVIEGMDVVESLTLRDPSKGGVLPEGDVIQSITIEEK